MKVLIDAGHGIGCPNGSPDKALMEWRWAREIAGEVANELLARGYDVTMVTPERENIGINKRVARVNKMCHLYGRDNVMVVSIHSNASGGVPGWHNARGWNALVAKNAGSGSRKLATILTEQVAIEGRPIMQPKSGQPYWERYDLGILCRTLCTAVLTESGFHDNRLDVAWLLSDEGKATCVRIHVEGIIKFIDSL